MRRSLPVEDNFDLHCTGEVALGLLQISPASTFLKRFSSYPALFALLCFVLIVPAVYGQTSIVAARGPNEVVIGADSKRRISEYRPDGTLVGVTFALACKIQKANGFYFGCSGPCGEVDIGSIIVQGSQGAGTIPQKTERVIPLIEEALDVLFTSKRPIALQRYTSSRTVLQLLLVGIQDQVPVIIGVDFYYRETEEGAVSVRAGEIDICPTSRDQCTHLAIGKTDAIGKFAKLPGSMDLLSRIKPVVAVERLIQMEIREQGDDVGPPIDILRVTRQGAQWIRRKAQCRRGVMEAEPKSPRRARGRFKI